MQQPELGKKINEARKTHGWSQEDLALEAKINVRSIQRIETGEVAPRLSTLKILSDLLEVDLLEKESQEATLWLMLMHLSSMFPVVIIPLIIWMWKKGDDSRIESHGPDVINFQISMMLYLMGGSLLMFVGVGLIIMPLFGLWIFFITLINTIKVAVGQSYRYPLSLHLIKL
jgi:uncharacterized Tic20 family protein